MIQAVMGVFLLELKRGDRVAAEKVGIYLIVYEHLSNSIQTVFKFCLTKTLCCQVFREWGNYMQGPQTSAVRDIIQVTNRYS